MTPLLFEQRYHQLRVDYRDKQGFAFSQPVNVHIYRQTSDTAQFPEKDLLVNKLDQEVRETGGLKMIDVDRQHRGMISRAFYGKGTPEDCTTALKYALRYGRTTPDRLQSYCDQVALIGLDCNGFVNNYFRALGRIAHDWSNDEYAAGTLRNAVSEIQAEDVLLWADSHGNLLLWPHAHIAVLASAPDTLGHATVVESAKSMGGLTHSTYTITRAGEHLFHVDRPASLTSPTGYVKIARVG